MEHIHPCIWAIGVESAQKDTHWTPLSWNEYITFCHFFTIGRCSQLELFDVLFLFRNTLQNYSSLNKLLHSYWHDTLSHTPTTTLSESFGKAKRTKRKQIFFCTKNENYLKVETAQIPQTNTWTTAIFVESRMYWHACVHSTMKWKVNERKSQMS